MELKGFPKFIIPKFQNIPKSKGWSSNERIDFYSGGAIWCPRRNLSASDLGQIGGNLLNFNILIRNLQILKPISSFAEKIWENSKSFLPHRHCNEWLELVFPNIFALKLPNLVAICCWSNNRHFVFVMNYCRNSKISRWEKKIDKKKLELSRKEKTFF